MEPGTREDDSIPLYSEEGLSPQRRSSEVLGSQLAFLHDVVLREEVLPLEVAVQHLLHSRRIPHLHHCSSEEKINEQQQ